jgi:hypothetical protein
MNNLRKLHFHLLTIWNGHSLSESDAPQELRDAILKAVDTSLVLLKDDKIACELKDELLFFLSCLHRDMPFEASKFFTQFIEDKERFGKYKRNTAYAIGDASLEWQSNLLKNVINTIINISDWPMIQISLEILAVASWRNKDIIFKIGDETARRILMQLKNSFEYNIKNMAEGKGFRALILSRHLELLLAILRLRTPQNRLLYPRDELTNWFVDQLAGIPDLLKVNNLELRSYIEFENIRKPVNEADVHNLVCALRLYLTSDDNANTIIINSVGFDD